MAPIFRISGLTFHTSQPIKHAFDRSTSLSIPSWYLLTVNHICLNILRFRAKTMPQIKGKWQGCQIGIYLRQIGWRNTMISFVSTNFKQGNWPNYPLWVLCYLFRFYASHVSRHTSTLDADYLKINPANSFLKPDNFRFWMTGLNMGV